jgi:predicted RNase H-like HicB family nuclease
MKFLVVIHKDDNSDYGVTVPDLPGCFSAGSTIEEALENTKEAIALHLRSMFSYEYYTNLLSIPRYMEDPIYKDGLFVFVEVTL